MSALFTSAVRAAFCGLLLAAVLPAQTLTSIFTGPPTGDARTMGAHRRALAFGADGSMWSLVYFNDRTGRPSGVHLLVMRSGDGGKTWRQVADTPTIRDTWGACVTGTDCTTLHVVWQSTNGAPSNANNLYYQTLDMRTAQWNGTPTLLRKGVNSNNQFLAHDIEITGQGTIVVAYGTHRQGPWTGGLLVKKAGSSRWSVPFRINVGLYGPNADLQAIGETVHIAYRSNIGLYGTFYRAFDTLKMAFVQTRDIPVGPNGNRGIKAGNVNCIADDGAGNLYVIYNNQTGRSPIVGQILVAYANAGAYGSWSTIQTIQDPPLRGGNTTNNNFSLATAPGGLVYAVYSKKADGYRKLYYRIFKSGKAIGPEFTAKTSTEANRFFYVNGLRSTQKTSGVMAVISGATTTFKGGNVSLLRFGAPARTVRFGVACANSSSPAPRLDARTLPLLGTTFTLSLSSLPAKNPGILLVGVRCQIPPISLGFLGRPACLLYSDIRVTVPFVSSSLGTASLSFPLQSNPTWIGQTIYFESYLPHAAGALLSNALAATLD